MYPYEGTLYVNKNAVTHEPSSVRTAVNYLKTARARVVYLKISKQNEGEELKQTATDLCQPAFEDSKS
jgi:hypothetical protein